MSASTSGPSAPSITMPIAPTRFAVPLAAVGELYGVLDVGYPPRGDGRSGDEPIVSSCAPVIASALRMTRLADDALGLRDYQARLLESAPKVGDLHVHLAVLGGQPARVQVHARARAAGRWPCAARPRKQQRLPEPRRPQTHVDCAGGEVIAHAEFAQGENCPRGQPVAAGLIPWESLRVRQQHVHPGTGTPCSGSGTCRTCTNDQHVCVQRLEGHGAIVPTLARVGALRCPRFGGLRMFDHATSPAGDTYSGAHLAGAWARPG